MIDAPILQKHSHIVISNGYYSLSIDVVPGSQFPDIVSKWEQDPWAWYTFSDDGKDWGKKGKVISNGQTSLAGAQEMLEESFKDIRERFSKEQLKEFKEKIGYNLDKLRPYDKILESRNVA